MRAHERTQPSPNDLLYFCDYVCRGQKRFSGMLWRIFGVASIQPRENTVPTNEPPSFISTELDLIVWLQLV